MTKASAVALMLAAGLMTGCGSSGGGSSTKTGTFEDAAVAGISYTTSSGLEGTTDADGNFKFKTGDTITFSIGSIVFPGGIPQDGIITPAHLAGTADWENDDTAVNIIQFLLSLDSDPDTDGIQIPEGIADYITESGLYDDVDFSDGGFDAGLDSLVADLNAEFTLTLEVVNETVAKAHFNATITHLGIDIEIQISTEIVACTAGNTAAIEGAYTTTLIGTLEGEKSLSVEDTTLTYSSDEKGTTCTFAQSEVVVGDTTIVTDTWIWTDGSDVYTITETSDVKSLTVLQGSASGTGTLTPNT